MYKKGDVPARALTVHSPLFFCTIIEIERFALRAAIFDECQNYIRGRGSSGGSLASLPLPF